MKTWKGILFVSLPGLLIIGGIFGFKRYRQEAQLSELKDERWRQFAWGNRKNLPPPYLETGNAKDLHFKSINLGLADFMEASEQGDVLYKWHGDGKQKFEYIDSFGAKRLSVYNFDTLIRLRRHDGSIVDFPKAKKVFLTPTGHVYAVFLTKNGYRLEKDEETIYDPGMSPEKSNLALLIGEIVAANDEALFVGSGAKGIQQYITPGLSLKTIDVPSGAKLTGISNSSTSGTYVDLVESGGSESEPSVFYKAKFVEGRIEKLDFPPEFANPQLFPIKNVTYIVPDDSLADTVITEYRNGKYAKLPSIPNAAKMTVLSANSSRDFILIASVQILAKIKNKPTRYTPVYFYVSNGKYYSFDEISTLNAHPALRSNSFLANRANQISVGQYTYLVLQNGDVVDSVPQGLGANLVVMQPLGK